MTKCVDQRLRRDLRGHEVRTAQEQGWAGKKNGELLALAAQEFDVFITVDRNLSFQQNFEAVAIAVLVLKAKSNRLADLKVLVPGILQLMAEIQPHQVIMVSG